MNIVGGDNRFSAGVDSTNRLLTRTVSRTDGIDAGVRGDAFFLLTPPIVLTTANESACWVFQNDEDRDLIITKTIVSASESVGATSQVFQNRRAGGVGLSLTGGAGIAMPVQNKIFGSNQSLDSTSEIGDEGATLTTPQSTSPQFITTGQIAENDTFLILPKGVGFATLVTPPAGNTSMTITFLLECYLRESL